MPPWDAKYFTVEWMVLTRPSMWRMLVLQLRRVKPQTTLCFLGAVLCKKLNVEEKRAFRGRLWNQMASFWTDHQKRQSLGSGQLVHQLWTRHLSASLYIQALSRDERNISAVFGVNVSVRDNLELTFCDKKLSCDRNVSPFWGFFFRLWR